MALRGVRAADIPRPTIPLKIPSIPHLRRFFGSELTISQGALAAQTLKQIKHCLPLGSRRAALSWVLWGLRKRHGRHPPYLSLSTDLLSGLSEALSQLHHWQVWMMRPKRSFCSFCAFFLFMVCLRTLAVRLPVGLLECADFDPTDLAPMAQAQESLQERAFAGPERLEEQRVCASVTWLPHDS